MSEFENIIAQQFRGPGNINLEYYDLVHKFRALILPQDRMDFMSDPELLEQVEILEALLIEAYIAIKSNECVGINNADDIKKATMMDVLKKIEQFRSIPGDVLDAIRLTLPGAALSMDHNSSDYRKYEELWFQKQPSRLEQMVRFNKFRRVAYMVCRGQGVSEDALDKLITCLYLFYDDDTNSICLTTKDASDEYMISEINALLAAISIDIYSIIDIINKELV